MSERLAQSLQLPRYGHSAQIVGIAHVPHHSTSHALTRLDISPISDPSREMPITAVVLPRITRDLPLQTVHFKPEWTHLTDLSLANPDFGCTGQIDVLLDIEVFTQVLCHGQWQGPPESPTAFNTNFGWVLAGETNYPTPLSSPHSIATHHATVVSGDRHFSVFGSLKRDQVKNDSQQIRET